MSSELHLEVLTPSRKVLSAKAEFVILPASDGELGVLPNHAPLVAALGIGVVRYGQRQGPKKQLALTGGFIEVLDNQITVLANAAERAEEIDLIRAEEAKKRAEQRLRQEASDVDFERAQLALQRAINRIRVASEK